MIEFIRVAKTYETGGIPVHALRETNLPVAEGEFVAVMGPSGSGKSTLLTILGAMNPPTQGQVAVDGIDVLDGQIVAGAAGPAVAPPPKTA